MIGLDSTFVIDFLKGESNAVEIAKRELENEALMVTPITIFEVFFGILLSRQNTEEGKVAAHEFFGRTQLVDLTPTSALQAAKLNVELAKKGNMMETTDVLIATALLHQGCTKVLTRDNDFARIKEMEIVHY